MSNSEREQLLAIIASQAKSNAELVATVEALRREISAQVVQIRDLSTKLDAALRQRYGRKSERQKRPKIPPVTQELGRHGSEEERVALRAERRALLAQVAVDDGEQDHPVTDEQRVCARCGQGAEFREVGTGKTTELYDFVPGYFRRSRHQVHTEACLCGTSIVTATGPVRSSPGSKYGPGLVAWVITQKCILSLPVNRVEKMLKSHGIPISRSTLNDLLLRAAEALEPIYEVLLAVVRDAEIVLADETPIKILSHEKQGYVWVFLGDGTVFYRFASGRSSKTPVEILGPSRGLLLTDGYGGYKPVTRPEGRTAVACLAHIRRKFFEALPTAPEAQQALDLILEVYRVEAEVKAAGIPGTEGHLILRQTRAGPAMGKLKRWMRQEQKHAPPKSPLGRAIAHTLGRWKAATRFLYDAAVPVDNNASERALRVVALGRKNFNGVGSKAAGHALAVLYTLVATCDVQNVDPIAYLRDVIVRVRDEAPEQLTPSAWAAALP